MRDREIMKTIHKFLINKIPINLLLNLEKKCPPVIL